MNSKPVITEIIRKTLNSLHYSQRSLINPLWYWSSKKLWITRYMFSPQNFNNSLKFFWHIRWLDTQPWWNLSRSWETIEVELMFWADTFSFQTLCGVDTVIWRVVRSQNLNWHCNDKSMFENYKKGRWIRIWIFIAAENQFSLLFLWEQNLSNWKIWANFKNTDLNRKFRSTFRDWF